MRACRWLVHLVRRLLQWLLLDRAGLQDMMSTCSLVLGVHELGQHRNERAFIWLLIYFYCRRRSP